MKLVILLALLISPSLAIGSPELRPLIDQTHVDGAGCSFSLAAPSKSDKDYLQWDFMASAWANIGSSDVQMTLVQNKSTDGRLHLGSRHIREFVGTGVKIVLSTKITSVCPKNVESCEAWRESGQIQVTSGGNTSTFPVQGICGS